MSISAFPITPNGRFNNDNNDGTNKDPNSAVGYKSSKPKTIEELNMVSTDLISGFEEEITSHTQPGEFWIAKATESMESFTSLINDYLVKKNERNLVDIDYDCIYIYYHACQTILNSVIPSLRDFGRVEKRYTALMDELFNNDMYFGEIAKIIELRSAPPSPSPPPRSQPTLDPLAARFNNLKKSFTASGADLQVINNSPAHQQPHQTAIHSEPTFKPSSRSRPVTPGLFADSQITHSYVPQPLNVSSAEYNSMQPPTLESTNDPKPVIPVDEPLKRGSPSPIKNQEHNVFKHFNNKLTITPSDLKELVSRFPASILVVDYRSTTDFANKHIYFENSANVIHIDPLSVGDGYNATDLEISSMVTNSEHERELFSKRDKFDLVVIYDFDSTTLESSRTLQAIFEILVVKNASKPLIRNPLLLSGGLSNWIKLYGASGIASNLGIIRDDLTIEVRHEVLSRPMAIPSRRGSSFDYYKNSSNNGYATSQGTPNSFEKSKYNRSQTDFFSQQFRGASAAPSTPNLSSQQIQPKVVRADSKTLQKLNVDLDRPQSAMMSPKRSSSVSSNDSRLLEAQKRQQQIDEFDSNLTIITGISNMGNTCYMNCILQCLVGTKGLTRFFLMNDYESKINFKSRLGSKGMISKGFHKVVNEMFNVSAPNAKKTYYITPQKFKQIIGALNSDFRGFQQQDCSEFLNFLLDSLHEDLNQRGDAPKFPPLTDEEEQHREKMSIRLAATIEWEKYLKTDFSSIVDFFQGQYLSRLQCTVCHTTSTTYNAFSTLSIPIPENVTGPITLDRCFEEFCKTEVLDGDDMWFCPRCKKKQRSTKTLKISILPKNLIIHLKRFKIGIRVTKLNSFVNYPFKISMLKYWPQVENDSDKLRMAKFPDRGQTPPFDYELYGVVNHFGTLREGHYTAYVDEGESNGVKNGWCYFDDTTVTRNCDPTKVINGSAYVLFYRRI